MKQMKNGAVAPAKTSKAGCGIRYSPESLADETCFDFSDAETLLSQHTGTEVQNSAARSEADTTSPDSPRGNPR